MSSKVVFFKLKDGSFNMGILRSTWHHSDGYKVYYVFDIQGKMRRVTDKDLTTLEELAEHVTAKIIVEEIHRQHLEVLKRINNTTDATSKLVDLFGSMVTLMEQQQEVIEEFVQT